MLQGRLATVSSTAHEPFPAKKPRARARRLSSNSAHRHSVARSYAEAARKIGLQTASSSADGDAIMLRYPVLVANKDEVLQAARKERLEIYKFLENTVLAKS